MKEFTIYPKKSAEELKSEIARSKERLKDAWSSTYKSVLHTNIRKNEAKLREMGE